MTQTRNSADQNTSKDRNSSIKQLKGVYDDGTPEDAPLSKQARKMQTVNRKKCILRLWYRPSHIIENPSALNGFIIARECG